MIAVHQGGRMYSLPVSDTMAIAVDDANPDAWIVHAVDFAARKIDSFPVTGMGQVQFAHFDRERELLWVIVSGTIFAIRLKKQQIFEVPAPDDMFFAYTMIGEGATVYVAGEYSNIWQIALPSLDWSPLLQPEPKQPRAADDEVQSRQTKDYARRYPPFYASFSKGNDIFFCGALGALARVRDGAVQTLAIDTGARLVAGGAEGVQISVSADSPVAQVYLGDFDGGFELIFSDDLRALNRTTRHAGTRYYAVSEYPKSDVHNLYRQDGKKLVPVETGCRRDPLPVISLSSSGSTLWVVDPFGMFRMADGAWELIEVDDLRRSAWPEAASER
jgi:hypothetical protein